MSLTFPFLFQGGGIMDNGSTSRSSRWRRNDKDLRTSCSRTCVHLCSRIRMVVGPAQLDHFRGDLPCGDTVSGTGRRDSSQLYQHIHSNAVVSHHDVPIQIRDFCVFCRLGLHHDGLCSGFPTGDKGDTTRVHGLCLGQTLVLASVCFNASRVVSVNSYVRVHVPSLCIKFCV